MHALSTPGAKTTSAPPPRHTPAPMHHPRRRGRVGHAVRPVAIAAAVTAAIALTGAINRPAVTLTSADAIDLAPGISVTPAPGWTVGNQGPGWVTLHNTFSTAEMEIKVKPANGTDPAALLQGDIRNLSNVSTTGLTRLPRNRCRAETFSRKPPSTSALMGHHGWARFPSSVGLWSC
jgi:hypothetical protein